MEERFRQLKQYIYYIIIFVISFITLVFLPMIGTDLNVGFSLPTTPAAWIVFIVTKSITAVVNVLLFYCFNQQAIINISKDPRYIQAREMLSKDNIKNAATKYKKVLLLLNTLEVLKPIKRTLKKPTIPQIIDEIYIRE